MQRRVGILGFALGVVFVLSGFAAVAAQAEVRFHSEVENTFLSGAQKVENAFTTSAGKVKCKKATFASIGAEKGAESGAGDFTKPDAKVIPAYGECTAYGQKAEIAVTNCYLWITRPEPSGGLNWHVKLANTAEWSPCSIQITFSIFSSPCKLTLQQQIPFVPTVELANEGVGSGRAIVLTSKVEGITYTVTGSSVVCGGEGLHTDGKYTGSVLLRGFQNEAHTEQVGIWQL